MRNAVEIAGGFIITTDNSGGIGGKPHDLVNVPDEVTAYFAARVALIEQWAAHADPIAVFIHNFSGDASWTPYVKGVEQAFLESNIDTPQISGSTETNMELLQSAVAVTMIGKKREMATTADVDWYVYGMPLVGKEVLERQREIASLALLRKAMEAACVQEIWPIGSKGILSEYRMLTGRADAEVEMDIDLNASAGPATAVLIGISGENIDEASRILGEPLHKIIEIDSSRH